LATAKLINVFKSVKKFSYALDYLFLCVN